VSLILNIDTAVESASICLSDKKSIAASKMNPSTTDSATWLHVAIASIFKEQNISVTNLSAIAISAGPGSYTGLRVSMSAAKGLCYSLNIPLIKISTLQMMAAAAKKTSQNSHLLCPMIDARRMEVFTALYNQELEEILPPTNMILDETSFHELLQKQPVTFFGNGSKKFVDLTQNANALFITVEATAEHLSNLSYDKYINQDFADYVYTEPYYGKEFYTTVNKKSN